MKLVHQNSSSKYVEDDWELWDKDNTDFTQVKDFSCGEDFNTPSFEQMKPIQRIELKTEQQVGIATAKDPVSDETEEDKKYFVEFQDDTGEVNQVQFMGDGLSKKSGDIILDIESLQKINGRKKMFEGMSSSIAATASTCSISNSDITEDFVCSNITLQGLVPVCGTTLSEFIGIISRRNCVERNFEECLDEFFFAADEISFSNGDDEKSLDLKEIELMTHSPIEKKKISSDLKCVEL